MKELPPPPPIWTPPPERWFDRHEHPLIARASDNVKTLNAMRLILHDRMGLPAPNQCNFTVVECEMLAKLAAKLGPALMSTWRMACVYGPKRGEDPETAFTNLLKAKGLEDE